MLGRPRWGRLALVAVLAVTPGVLFASGGREARPLPPAPPLLVRVEYGDSLWTIAREHGDPRRDVRAVVAEIRRVNGLDPARLRPGSLVAIPAEFAAGDH